MSGTKAVTELNGDIRLTPWQRILYLVRNFRRNLGRPEAPVKARPFCCGRVGKAEGTPSPGRLIGHVFVDDEMPKLLPGRTLRVLDIGCGPGRLSTLLSHAGFRGTYVGVDIDDRFVRDTGEADKFEREFIFGDAHDLPETETYDLVFSNSALEHIPDDRRLLEKLDRLVAPGGLQVHMVPSGWGLLLYLWHGYRQYPLSRIASLFPAKGTDVYGLGGICCFLLHLAFISLGEIVLRLKLRARLPRLYRNLLNGAVTIDRGLGFCPGMYVICRKTSGGGDRSSAGDVG